MSATEQKKFKDYFEYAYCKKMLNAEFEKYDIDERIRRIAADYFRDKVPGCAGPIPDMSRLKERETWRSKAEFEDWPGRPRLDGLRMREMIELIDEALRKTKAGTVTGSYKHKMYVQQRKESFCSKNWTESGHDVNRIQGFKNKNQRKGGKRLPKPAKKGY